ncbi:ATP-binding protein [Pseudomonas fluvialis]|uniref:ATP-binding protein n=1 Tax=Pseudomonas fluvialis TaxID=1793966 RepID=UPI0035AD9ED6
MNKLRQRLDNLPVGHKLLAALLVLLLAVLLLANLAFISAAYWISRESLTPQSLHTLARLIASPALSQQALSSPQAAQAVLQHLDSYTSLRAAALYDRQGNLLAQLQRGSPLPLPEQASALASWQQQEFRASLLQALPEQARQPGYLLLVASSEVPGAFYTGTLSASLVILLCSLLFGVWVLRQVRRLITRPIRRLEELSQRVTREENYALRARPGNQDEIGSLATAFNTMLERMANRERELQEAHAQTRQQSDAHERSNRKLALEVQVRSKIEKKLTGFQKYLNDIIDSMPSALIAVDEQLYVSQWNQQASRLAGCTAEQALHRPCTQAFAALRDYLLPLQQCLARQQVQRIERVCWPDAQGQPRHYDLTLYPLSGKHGLVIRIDDITERLAMEALMVQSEKMLSIGGLAAGMAHEINNPLGAILHNVQNIRRRLSVDLPRNQDAALSSGVRLEAVNHYLQARDIPHLLEGIQQAGSRASRIVRHMLSFSRRSDHLLHPCALEPLLEQALEIAGNDFALVEGLDFQHLHIERDYASDLPAVPVIASELEQVLLNLLKNAAQAIQQRPAGSPPGRILLRTRRCGAWAQIELQDNGVGMDDAVRKRIFEPFFTTKDVGQGSGLGLSVSYFIITNNHKGQMDVQARPGQGTCFTLRLPLPGVLPSPPAQAGADTE